MALILEEGKVKNMSLEVTPSTAIATRSLLAWVSGQLVAATASTNKEDIAGVAVRAIVSTDDDFADERQIEVEVPMEKNVTYKINVTSGLVAADKGLFQDMTDSTTVDRTASSKDVVQCMQVLSTTLGIFKLNIGGAGV